MGKLFQIRENKYRTRRKWERALRSYGIEKKNYVQRVEDDYHIGWGGGPLTLQHKALKARYSGKIFGPQPSALGYLATQLVRHDLCTFSIRGSLSHGKCKLYRVQVLVQRFRTP